MEIGHLTINIDYITTTNCSSIGFFYVLLTSVNRAQQNNFKCVRQHIVRIVAGMKWLCRTLPLQHAMQHYRFLKQQQFS